MIRKRKKTHKTYKSNERVQSSRGWGYAISICPALLADKHSLQQQGLVQVTVVKSPCSASCCPTLLGSRAVLKDNPRSYKHHGKALALCTHRLLRAEWEQQHCSPLPLMGSHGNGATILQEEVVKNRQDNFPAVISSHSQASTDKVCDGPGFPMQDVYRYHTQARGDSPGDYFLPHYQKIVSCEMVECEKLPSKRTCNIHDSMLKAGKGTNVPWGAQVHQG